jgi:hypothetical protein
MILASRLNGGVENVTSRVDRYSDGAIDDILDMGSYHKRQDALIGLLTENKGPLLILVAALSSGAAMTLLAANVRSRSRR